MSAGRQPVTFLGVLPPPVNGMTLASNAVVQRLAQCCDLRVIKISHPRHHRGWRWRLVRGTLFLRAALRLIRARPRDGERLYLVANSGGGLHYDLLLVKIARARGYRIVLHHQVYSYLHRYDPRMARIDRCMDESDLHVCLAPRMIDRFSELYRSKASFIHLPNTIAITPPDSPAQVPAHSPANPVLTLGHISNLAIAKGLDTVLATHRALVAAGRCVKLILAGPCQSPREQRLVEDARRQLPDLITWIGPVRDAEKWRFFREIDVMLFPTRYRSEAQPLVVAEALMAGVPVIACDRACIADLIGEDGGACVAAESDFVAAAVELITRYLDDAKCCADAKERAARRGLTLRREAHDKLQAFCHALSQPAIQRTAAP